MSLGNGTDVWYFMNHRRDGSTMRVYIYHVVLLSVPDGEVHELKSDVLKETVEIR